ncbi:MAG: beta-ketoacyl synthase chain length factor [Enterovibrio sp.]
MKFTLNLIDWKALAPGLSEPLQWQNWSKQPFAIDPNAAQAKLTELPMMTARRLSSGSKLAVECGLAMLRQHAIDAILYTSRHGELERNFRILKALATQQALSPTDFAMSVHNSAVGNLTIVAKHPAVYSSLSAGQDTFQQGLCEIICLLQAGYQRVLMVDFDGVLPDFYHPSLPVQMPKWAYAIALVFEAGNALECRSERTDENTEAALPQSLQFLQHVLNDSPMFSILGDNLLWRWSQTP